VVEVIGEILLPNSLFAD